MRSVFVAFPRIIEYFTGMAEYLADQRNQTKRRLQTAVNIFSGIFALVVSSGISFFVLPLIVKSIGEEASGFANLANDFITFASLLSLAVNSMGSRFISMAYHQGNLEKCKKYYSSIFVMNLLIVGILILPSTVFVFFLDKALNVSEINVLPARILFIASFANFYAGLFATFLSVPLHVFNKNSTMNVVSIFNSAFRALFLFVAFSFISVQIYWSAVAGLIFTVLTIPFYWFLKRRFFASVPLSFSNFSWASVGEILKSGVWNVVNQCGHILMSGLDLLLANLFISGAEMGMLSIAKTIPLLILSLSTTINNNYANKQIITYSIDGEEQLLKSIESSCRVSSYLLSVPIAVFCIFSVPFYNLWQPTLDPEKLAVLSIFAISYFVPFTATASLYNALTAKNMLSFNAITYVVTGVVSSVVTILLVRFTDLGVYAIAAVSSVVSVARNAFLMLPYYARIFSKRWWYFFHYVVEATGAFALSSIISAALLFVFRPASWLTLVLGVALSAFLSYLLLSPMLVRKRHIEFVIGQVKKVWKK